MSNGRYANDDWLECARVEMYEEMRDSGMDKFHDGMDKRVREAAEAYGFTVVKSPRSARAKNDEERRKAL